MKKVLFSLFLLIIPFFMTSCWTQQEVIIPPDYEKIQITHNTMLTSDSSWSTLNWDTLLSFDIQKNKFILDSDLNYFSDKYSYILKSKDLTDKSYVWINLFSLDSIVMDYKEDIERKLQSKNVKYTSVNNIWDCLIASEWTEFWEWFVFVKTCWDSKYLIQLTTTPYDNKEWKKEIWYKAFLLDSTIRKFLIEEYFNYKNNVDSFDTSNITVEKWQYFNYTFLPNTPNYNWYIQLKKWNKILSSYVTNRQLIVKWDYWLIFDTLVDVQKNFDLRFELIKNINTYFDKFSFANIPWKFITYNVFNLYNVNINEFLLYKKDIDKYTTTYYWRFPNSIEITLHEHNTSSFWNNLLSTFEENFWYKEWFSWPTINDHTTQYSYKWQNKTYILILWRDEKWNKEMKWKSIYVIINNNFIKDNIKTYSDFIWTIK